VTLPPFNMIIVVVLNFQEGVPLTCIYYHVHIKERLNIFMQS